MVKRPRPRHRHWYGHKSRPRTRTRPKGWTAAGAKYITQFCPDSAQSADSLSSPYEPLPFIILTFIQPFAALIKSDARPYLLTISYVCFVLFADPPTVSVHLANEDPSRLVTRAEGQNVTFKCRADARPPVTSYAWFKNVSDPVILRHLRNFSVILDYFPRSGQLTANS